MSVPNRRLSIAVGALTLSLIAGSATAALPNEAAQAGPVIAAAIEPGQTAPISGVQSGRCLSVPNSSTANGTQTQLWDCNGAAGQLWTYTVNRQLMVYGNKCLDAEGRGTANGTRVI